MAAVLLPAVPLGRFPEPVRLRARRSRKAGAVSAPLPDPPPVVPAPRPHRRPTVRRIARYEPPYDDELPALRIIRQREELPFEEPPSDRVEHLDPFEPPPALRRDLPDPVTWATRFIQAVVETMAGSRASAQLAEWTSQSVHAQVVRGPRDARWRGTRPMVRSVRAGEPSDGVAEVSAVVQRGREYVAVAARLEGFDGRWRAVALELG